MSVATVRCPICKKEVATNDPNMPFCSDRCRLLDLGNWASEKYVVSTPRPSNEWNEDDHDAGEERKGRLQ